MPHPFARSWLIAAALVVTITGTARAQELVNDASTALLLHLNSTTTGASGETAAQATGLTFESGIWSQAVRIDGTDQLKYTASGNIVAQRGTVEFWLKPAWNGSDAVSHWALSWGTTGGLLVGKDSANNWRIIVNRYVSERGAAVNVGSEWVAGAWHHCAFTWDSLSVRVYVDGVLRATGATNVNLPAISATQFQVGSDGTGGQIGAAMDEVRISNRVRSATEIQDSYLRGLQFTAIAIQPDTLQTYPGWSVTPTITGTTNVGSASIPSSLLTWGVGNPAIASVDTLGRVAGLVAGTTSLVGTYGGVSDTIVVNVKAATVDLGVSFIDRTPHDTQNYQVAYTTYSGIGVPHLVPGTESAKRWPNAGEHVTLVGHVVNKGYTPSGPFNCVWTVNGGAVDTVRVTPGVAARGEATVTLDYVWPSGFDSDHSDQTVGLQVDTGNEVAELYEGNNSYTDYPQGLAIYFYTDQATYDAFDQRLNLVGTTSYEDWVHAQFAEMNQVFARSTYTGATAGCLERVRLAKLVVGEPPTSDHTEDGDWYLTGGTNYAGAYALQVDGGLLHELMHQLGLLDLYNMGVEIETNKVQTPDNISTGMTFDWGRAGLMGGGSIEPHTGPAIYLSRWDVLALNKNCGYRRGYFGEPLYDVPQGITLQVLDAAGVPAAGVQVRVFQRLGGVIDNTPEIVGTTDGAGQFVLPNRAVSEATTTATGHSLAANPFATIDVVGGNSNLLVEMSRGADDFDYAWMTLSDVNLACWDGATSLVDTLHSRLAATALGRIKDLAMETSGNNVRLTWSAVPGADSYTIYRASRFLNRASDPSHEFENWAYRPLATIAAPGYSDATHDETSRYAVAANQGGLSGPLSNRAFAPLLWQPMGVALHSNGRRTVLDAQNGYALIRQDTTGTFLENFGSVHNHLECSNYIAVDNALNHLVISHPGDAYTSRQSVKVTDLEGTNILEIGNTGTGTGYFQQPRGVAVNTSGRILVADDGNSRVQVFESNGTFVTAFGSAGAGTGQFNGMRGMAIDTSGRVFVCDAGNDRVAVLQLTGDALAWVGQISGIADPTGVAIAPGGEILVSDAGTDAVLVYTSGLSFVRSLTTPLGYFGGTLVNPSGLVALDNVRILVCDSGNRRVATLRIDGTTDVPGPVSNGAAARFALYPARPSVFNGATLVRFEVPDGADRDLSVFDVSGRRVRLLTSGRKTGATESVRWDGRDDHSVQLRSGVFFLRLRSGGHTAVQRVVLMR